MNSELYLETVYKNNFDTDKIAHMFNGNWISETMFSPFEKELSIMLPLAPYLQLMFIKD